VSGASACPRCGAALDAAQDWCLECGLAARTRVAPPPNWRLPLAALAAVALAAVLAIVLAFALLTGNDNPVAPTGTAPVTSPDTAPPATATVPAPAAAAPPATTPAP
jgi:hypothetical protein